MMTAIADFAPKQSVDNTAACTLEHGRRPDLTVAVVATTRDL